MKVKNNEPRLIVVGGFFNLAPGVNEVADHLWLKATHNPGKVLQHWFKSKVLEVIEQPRAESVRAFDASTKPGAPQLSPEEIARSAGAAAVGSAKTEGTTGLAHLKPKDAEELISDTFDRDTLESWLQSETRKAVREALETQLELTKVEPPKKK